MKYLRITVVILLATALLWGCSEKKYRFVEDESGDYIIYPYEYDDMSNHVPGCMDVQYIYFSSLEEMRSDIKNGNFTEEELEDLRWMYDDIDTGRINVCDLDNMRVPTYPSDCQEYRICWHGTSYLWEVQIDQQATATITDYELAVGVNIAGKIYESDFTIFDPDEYLNNTSLITSLETEEDRNAQVIYSRDENFEEWTMVRKIYTFNADGTEHHVLEEYEGAQSTVPSRIWVMYQQGGRYTRVFIMGLSERPSIEYLAQFGSAPEK